MVYDPTVRLPSAKLPAFDGLQRDVWGEERMGLEVRAESRRFLREARLAAAHVEPFALMMVYRNLGMSRLCESADQSCTRKPSICVRRYIQRSIIFFLRGAVPRLGACVAPLWRPAPGAAGGRATRGRRRRAVADRATTAHARNPDKKGCSCV